MKPGLRELAAIYYDRSPKEFKDMALHWNFPREIVKRFIKEEFQYVKDNRNDPKLV
jgi:hypothetical protein